MSDHVISGIVTIATAIIGVAIIAVLVGQRAQTGNVIASAGGALAQDIAAAVSPVTGAGSSLGDGGFGFGGFNGSGAPGTIFRY